MARVIFLLRDADTGADGEAAALAAGGVAAVHECGVDAAVASISSPTALEPGTCRLVFASDLVAALEAVAPEQRTWAGLTMLVNAERGEVLDLLERHGLLGAVECEGPEAWVEGGARLFVRRDVVSDRGAGGEAIGGQGRESDRFILWTHENSPTLAALLARYVALAAGAVRDDTVLTIDAGEAVRQGLPAVGIQVQTGGTGMVVTRFPVPGSYLRMHGPPGGPLSFGVEVADPVAVGDLGALIRQQKSAPHQQPVVVGDAEPVSIGGVEREALSVLTGKSFLRTAWCYALVRHRSGVLLLAFAKMAGEGPSVPAARVLAHPGLSIIARTFRVIESPG